MAFQIEVDKYEEAYAILVQAMQDALLSAFAEEAEARGLRVEDVARELGISSEEVTARLNGFGISTLRAISDLFTAMGRAPVGMVTVDGDR